MKIGALLGLFGACFTLCALPRQGEVGLNERVSVRTRTQKVSGLKKEEDSKSQVKYICYDGLWDVLHKKNISTDELRKLADISVRSVAKMQANESVRSNVIQKICQALECTPSDIISYVDEKPKIRIEKRPKRTQPRCSVQELNLEMPPQDSEFPVSAEFTFIDLFAGIGGIRLGFESVGGKCVFSSEWDKNAAKTYEANFGEKPHGDITKIEPSSIPDFDILLGGFPCQPFSIIGDKEGFNHETQGTLFFNIEKILLEKKPKAFMLENVRNLTAHDKGRTFKIIISHLENAGYTVYHKVLNALDYGVPQKRERIIIVGFRDEIPFEYPKPTPRRVTIKDILDPEAELDKSLFVKPSIRESRLRRNKYPDFPKPYISHENVAGSITPHDFSCALRAGASANYLLINDERRPSARELLRIQGFPDSYKIVVPYGHIKHQTGNSVAVPVIKAVARQMVKAMKEKGVLK